MNLLIGQRHVLCVEIGADSVEDSVRTGPVELRHDKVPGICLGLRRREIELLRHPLPYHPVAARVCLELQLLVVRELRLETFFDVLEGDHDGDSALTLRPWTLNCAHLQRS